LLRGASLRFVKSLVHAGKEDKHIWLKEEDDGDYQNNLEIWNGTLEEEINHREAYCIDERRFKQWVVVKDGNFPNYCAHFLIPGKLAVGEGPFNGVLSSYEYCESCDAYDNTQRFLDAILTNRFTNIIAIGAPMEVRENGKMEHKFTMLFDTTPKSLTIGPYRLRSILVKKGKQINEYLLTISTSKFDYQVRVEHLFNIRDGQPFPGDDLEIRSLFTRLIESLHKEKHKVFVHCAAGLGRSGILAGVIYLGLNHKDRTDRELAEFIFRMWNNFNMIRPGAASGKRQIRSIVELYLQLFPRTT
jgi:hypothetical protein